MELTSEPANASSRPTTGDNFSAFEAANLIEYFNSFNNSHPSETNQPKLTTQMKSLVSNVLEVCGKNLISNLDDEQASCKDLTFQQDDIALTEYAKEFSKENGMLVDGEVCLMPVKTTVLESSLAEPTKNIPNGMQNLHSFSQLVDSIRLRMSRAPEFESSEQASSKKSWKEKFNFQAKENRKHFTNETLNDANETLNDSSDSVIEKRIFSPTVDQARMMEIDNMDESELNFERREISNEDAQIDANWYSRYPNSRSQLSLNRYITLAPNQDTKVKTRSRRFHFREYFRQLYDRMHKKKETESTTLPQQRISDETTLDGDNQTENKSTVISASRSYRGLIRMFYAAHHYRAKFGENETKNFDTPKFATKSRETRKPIVNKKCLKEDYSMFRDSYIP